MGGRSDNGYRNAGPPKEVVGQPCCRSFTGGAGVSESAKENNAGNAGIIIQRVG